MSSAYLGIEYFLKNTKEIPAFGGEYAGGMIGQPRFINPALSQTSDIDSDLANLVYSSLLKLDEKGKLVNDLAESYEISPDNLTYTFKIKKGVKWHDEEDLRARNMEVKDLNVDDIVFTIQIIQGKDFNSPLAANWKGIQTERIDDYTIKFILKNSYSPFLNNLTFGILPKHLWKNIGGTGNFPLAENNLKPIGSGQYKFKRLAADRDGRISSIELAANDKYYFKTPYIEKLTFKFFQSEEDAISAFNKKEIKGINYISAKNKAGIADSGNSTINRLNMPRYFAVFFNQTKSKALSDKTVRTALNQAIDRNKIINDVLSGDGTAINSPIPPQLLGYNPDIKNYEYSIEEAKKTLEEAGWVDKDGNGIREKDDVSLKFSLVSTDWPELISVSGLLQEMWKNVGADVEIKNLDINEIQNNYIKTRSYEALLFGEILNYDPDPFAFWHSSQKKDPGLNFSMYDNADVDKLLEEARQETDQNKRSDKYKKFQEYIAQDIPAAFLYSPYYLYVQSKLVKGTSLNNIVIPSDRFNSINNWYVKTKRVWK